jgi:hypothetical protein
MGQTDLLLGIRLERRTEDLIRMYRIGDINRDPCLPRSLFQFRCERSNRPAAANRAEETMGGFAMA